MTWHATSHHTHMTWYDMTSHHMHHVASLTITPTHHHSTHSSPHYTTSPHVTSQHITYPTLQMNDHSPWHSSCIAAAKFFSRVCGVDPHCCWHTRCFHRLGSHLWLVLFRDSPLLHFLCISCQDLSSSNKNILLFMVAVQRCVVKPVKRVIGVIVSNPGKKNNIMKKRIDSNDFQIDQLLLGTLCFTLVVFLIPTVAVYYFFFGMLRSQRIDRHYMTFVKSCAVGCGSVHQRSVIACWWRGPQQLPNIPTDLTLACSRLHCR